MEKINNEELVHVNHDELHDNYIDYTNVTQKCSLTLKQKTRNKKIGVSKMAKTIAQASVKKAVPNYINSESNYKGVNKMAKQIALANESRNKSEPVFINQDNSDNGQIQRLTVDMPSDLHKEFKVWCVMNNLKMNELIRDLIRETIKA